MCEKRARKKARRSWVDGSNSFLLATIGAIPPAFGYLMGMRGRGVRAPPLCFLTKKGIPFFGKKVGHVIRVLGEFAQPLESNLA